VGAETYVVEVVDAPVSGAGIAVVAAARLVPAGAEGGVAGIDGAKVEIIARRAVDSGGG
jgi:hypothetical protein